MLSGKRLTQALLWDSALQRSPKPRVGLRWTALFVLAIQPECKSKRARENFVKVGTPPEKVRSPSKATL